MRSIQVIKIICIYDSMLKRTLASRIRLQLVAGHKIIHRTRVYETRVYGFLNVFIIPGASGWKSCQF